MIRVATIFQLVFFLVLSLLSQKGIACSSQISRLDSSVPHIVSLCQLQDEYNLILNQLMKLGYSNPERIANAVAPRFINLQVWEAKKGPSMDSAKFIYNPSPLTWDQWESAASKVDLVAKEYFNQAHPLQIDLAMIQEIHFNSMNMLVQNPGQLRQSAEVGMALSREHAPTKEQVLAMKNIDFRSMINSQQPLAEYVSTECLEDQSAEFINNFAICRKQNKPVEIHLWPVVDQNKYFRDAKGIERQCGYIQYPHSDEVPRQLDNLIKYVNRTLNSYYNESNSIDAHFFTFLSRVQRWFVLIHPFQDGNGRVSRLLLDLIVKSLGLPPSILSDQSLDMYSSESDWALQIAAGMHRTIGIMKTCITYPETVGCLEVKRGQGEVLDVVR